MRLTLGPLSVTIKYVYARGSTVLYQRAVPTDLRGRYAGPNIKVNLNTSDPIKVARKVEALNRKYEAEWAGLRAAPEASPEALKAHAGAFLGTFGLTAKATEHDPMALEVLHDYIDGKRARFAGGDEDAYAEADPLHYLTPVEIAAGRLLHHPRHDTITGALEVYLDTNKRKGDETFEVYARRAFGGLVAACGDKDVKAFTREDARHFIAVSMEQGNKSGTVRRRINSFRAVWAAYAREVAHGLYNPWEGLNIPGEGKDAQQRTPFTNSELETVLKACQSRDDDMRWIVALLMDTGARLAEVAGLALEDIRLDAVVPHIVIKPQPWRSVKTDETREVPLVGASLWAARRVVESAKQGQRFAFPRYTDEHECRATAASGGLVKWLKAQRVDKVIHELRHTMKDRLREVQCQKPITDSILGHASRDVGDDYGLGYSLGVKVDWLSKVALKVL